MGVNVLNIGSTGLQAAQIGIATTGQNISNASTPGYSEEVSQQVAAPAQGYSFGYLGHGTEVQTVVRQYNQLLSSQINSTQSASSQLSAYSNLITPLDNLVADPKAGLSPVLQSFFSSLQNLSANPSAVSSMQTAMSSAQTLVSQFQALQTQVNQSTSTVNSQISSEVTTINTDAQQLASVNQAIQIGYAAANNQPPNTLLDQRDLLINKLSQETQVSVVPEGNMYNVFIGNGQPLVMGAVANSLTTVASASNPTNLEVAFSVNGTTQPISEANLPGGTLGGTFAFRTNSLSPIQNTLGQIAIVLGSALNAQNKLGQTVSGAMGQDLFTIAAPLVNANAGNSAGAQITATIANPGALKPDNYTLSLDGGGNYTFTDTTTNTPTVFASAAAFAAAQPIDGVTYAITGAMSAGDSFSISPTAAGASGFGLTTTDPTAFASAAPISTSTASTNTGSGVMTPGSVTTGFIPANAAPPTGTTLTYTAGAPGTLTLNPSPASVMVNGVVTAQPITYTSGMTISFNNMSFSLSGTPANGDTFTVGPNTNATGDNRNVLLMNGLLTQNTMNNGTGNFQGVYAQLVNAVGNTTSQVNTMGATETSLLTAATKQQQSISGVNLDQETVNLLQYQQVYQACGKLIQVASQNFSTVLNLDGSA